MELHAIDWAIIAGYFVLSLGIGLWFKNKAGENYVEYFASGRSLPWWIAGLSMVATTFAADTPLAVTGLIAQNGIAGNWLWWNAVASGMLTVFFFAALWRRAGVMTDVELVEIRYGGKAAAALRGFRAAYLVGKDQYELGQKDYEAALAINPRSLKALGAKGLHGATLALKDVYESAESAAMAVNPQPAEFFEIVKVVGDAVGQQPGARLLDGVASGNAVDGDAGGFHASILHGGRAIRSRPGLSTDQ